MGKLLIYIGIVLVIVGAILLNTDKLGFLGNLPGDIRINRHNFKLYIPITTCLLISILLSAVIFLIQKLR